MEKFPQAYPTAETIAEKVETTREAVTLVLSAYRQIRALKAKVDPSIVTQVTMLSEGVVRPIKSAPESAKVALVSVVAEKGLSGRESAALVEVAKANPETSKISLPMLL